LPSLFEAEVLELLRAKHRPPQWAFLTHVPNETGGARRVCDGLAMNLWRSQGMEVCGYEVKADRSDWRRELKDPAKADLIAGYCDRFDIVAPPGVVKPEELPVAWGLFEVRTNRKDARFLRRTITGKGIKPKPLDRLFVAALLRRVHAQISPETQIATARDEGFVSGRRAGLAQASDDAERWEERYNSAKKTVEDFEKASGISMRWQDPVKIGKAVAMLAHGARDERARLDRALGAVTGVAEVLAKVLAEFPAGDLLSGDPKAPFDP